MTRAPRKSAAQAVKEAVAAASEATKESLSHETHDAAAAAAEAAAAQPAPAEPVAHTPAPELTMPTKLVAPVMSVAAEAAVKHAAHHGKTVHMVRDPEVHPNGPYHADVHPDEVENWAQHGWRVA